MNRKFSGILILLVLSPGLCTAQENIRNEPTFPADALKKDLVYLKEKLETYHPGLYLYTQKTAIDKLFDSLESSISKPLTELEFYKHITCISSIIKDGHSILLPSEKSTTYHNKYSRFLPYHFAVINNRLYADMVCTNDRSIAAGTEIISINKTSSAEILRQLMERQIRDGNNQTYPTWILNNYFREYYSFIYGHPDSFEMGCKANGQAYSTTIRGLLKDSIYYYRQQLNPGKQFSRVPNEGITLKFEKENHYAILTIKDFHDDILKNDYQQNFYKTIRDYFDQINTRQVKKLVIDLRNNQGGDIENGVFLLSCLLDKPFRVVQDYLCVENQQLVHCNGPSAGVHQPRQPNFKGSLYVLVNGGSFSNSGIVSSCLQASKRAVFVGEETGGNPFVINGYAKDINLPATKIQVQIPTKQFVITDKLKNNGQGLSPDHRVVPTLDDLLNGRDRELDYTVELMMRDE